MNLVAHQYLSFNNPSLQIGNLLGEVVKGNQYKNFNKELSKGILLHRAIDSFTDSHEIVKQSSAKFHSTQHKYSPIIVDLIYDYFLIKNWSKFHDKSYTDFKEDCYLLFQSNSKSTPPSAQKIINYILEYDWFGNYATLDGIQKTLNGISKRTNFENNLMNATPEILQYKDDLEKEFLVFFPELIEYCKYFIDSK